MGALLCRVCVCVLAAYTNGGLHMLYGGLHVCVCVWVGGGRRGLHMYTFMGCMKWKVNTHFPQHLCQSNPSIQHQ